MKVKLKDIHPMVKAKAVDKLAATMDTKSFKHPIILYRTTKYEWECDKRDRYPQILDPPNISGEILQIRCGHNRVALAEQWGEEEIDAVVYDNLEEAMTDCRAQQKWFKNRYGSLD